MAAAPPVEKADSKELVFTTSLEDEKLGNHSVDDSQRFIPGSEGVTQHDLDTLRHVADRLPASTWLVAIVELAERNVLPPFPHGSSIMSAVVTGGHITVLRTSSTTTSAPLSPNSLLLARL